MHLEPPSTKYKAVIDDLAKDFIEKLSFINESNNGLFHALLDLSTKMQLWELQIILTIAESQPIKTEDLISRLNLDVSKSTIYRKINNCITTNVLVKDSTGELALHESLRAIEIVAKIHKKLTSNQENINGVIK